MLNFIFKQFKDIRIQGFDGLKKKFLIILPHIFWIPLYLTFLPIIFIIKFIGLFYIIRFEKLKSGNFGNVTQSVELYLCEKKFKINTLNKPYIDIFFSEAPVCNKDLFKIFRRNIIILPKLLIYPLYFLAKNLSGFSIHIIGNNSQSDRDINNLFDKSESFFKFNKFEEKIGREFLNSIGISKQDKFICLNIRESAYHKKMNFHNYRNGDIDNYFLACEELTKFGYYIFRMGAKAIKPLKSKNKMIIDYAMNGMRTEFLDLYLGANCFFCISTSSGFDAIPIVSRKPLLFITVPIGYFYTFSYKFMSMTKHHFDSITKKNLSLNDIFKKGVGFSLNSKEYKDKGINLIENSPIEIKNAAVEFHKKIQSNFFISKEEVVLKNKFWELYNNYVKNYYVNGNLLHGKIKSNICFSFLNHNKYFLD